MKRLSSLQVRVAVSAGLCLIIISASFLLLPWFVLHHQRIAPNIFVQGVAVGGLTRREASHRIAAKFSDISINITAANRSWTLPIKSLGGTPDIKKSLARAFAVGRTGHVWNQSTEIVSCWRRPREIKLGFIFDPDSLQSGLRGIARQVNRAPMNARLGLSGDRMITKADRQGLRMDVAETARLVQRQFGAENPSVTALVRTIPARIRLTDVEGVKSPLVTFRTWYNAGQGNRSGNIRLCARLIHGTILMPGDTFSFNRRVGERTPRRGFRLAPIFVNKEKGMGYGGGACQVSTTVYNVARNAQLQIVERHRHSLPVPYVPEGRDATVVYPYSDMKFKNTSGMPLFIEAHAHGGRLTIRLWGGSQTKIARSDVTARVHAVKYPEHKRKPIKVSRHLNRKPFSDVGKSPSPQAPDSLGPKTPEQPSAPPSIASPASDVRPRD